MSKTNLVKTYFLFQILHLGVSGQECPSHIMTNFNQKNCTSKENNGTSFYYWLDETTCFPTCMEYKEEGYNMLSCPCPPAYVCVKRCKNTNDICQTTDDCSSGIRNPCVDKCVAGTASCMSYHASTFDFKENYYTAKFKPDCTNDGAWEAKQCKGGVSGRCMCYDANGKRIFGQALYKDSSDMTCACSRRKADLIAAGLYYSSLHCDSKGNYEELQCDSGLCWCADPPTGNLTSPVVPEKAMVKLPCYKQANIGTQYLRKCDSVAYAMAYIINKLQIRGMKYVNLGNIQCDGDGAYGAYNMSGGIARCTWRDGSTIGTWQSDVSTDISTLNCYCARDYKIYSHQLTCDGSGNYQSVQTVIDQNENYFYCVDSDGFPKSDIFSSRIDNCTSYY